MSYIEIFMQPEVFQEWTARVYEHRKVNSKSSTIEIYIRDKQSAGRNGND